MNVHSEAQRAPACFPRRPFHVVSWTMAFKHALKEDLVRGEVADRVRRVVVHLVHEEVVDLARHVVT